MSVQFRKHLFLAVPILCLICATVMMAQVKTYTDEQAGKVTHQANVERGEVVYIAGNELVVRMEGGEIRTFTVPDGATAMVDGKKVTLKDLKPGMKLERTITTTSTEKTVRTVKTGTGKVVSVMPPLSVVLQFEDYSVQQFKIPKDQIFYVNGEKKTAFELKKGMTVTATRIEAVPAVEVSTSRQTTGTAPPPETPPQQGVLLIAEPSPPPSSSASASTSASAPASTSAPAPAAAAPPATQKLPATGSLVPLIGLLGMLFSGASLGMRLLRRS
jgi:hypothetical protein